MAFNRPTLGQLISTAEAEINALIPNADARLRFSMLNVFARVWAALTDGLYSALVFLSRQLFVMTATRRFLELIAESYGIYRLPPTAAQGSIAFQGLPNSPIVAGTVFQRSDGVQYQITGGGFISGAGYLELPAVALTAGALGNAPAQVQLQSTSPVAGLQSAVVAGGAIAGGADEETDDGLRVRTLQRIRNPPGAGTSTDWERWARQLSSGVTRVWVVPTVYGNGTVAVVFAQDNDGIVPPPTVVQQMRDHLAQFTPEGTVLYVFAPTLKPVPFTIHEIPNSDPAVRQNISNELQDLLYREAGPGKTIPLTHVSEAISGAQGEYDHSMTVPSGPLVFSAFAPLFEVGVMGAITWG
ncbi:baseplate J/gp47 family protein [uncultured Variovorax sp.]|jgi:uncharacterized phage protein gp47/JayE|uniref:baseplate J/gp47 family protein n=1 Tax=uncultured Variovorax sp. TaxID=114708 RepID=UPI00262A3CE4|nr:baseplate J/gp47 family protein [uncultured Variovorax sp.]